MISNSILQLLKPRHKDKMHMQAWRYMPIIPALGRLRQEDFCEFEVSLGYIVHSRLPENIQQKPISKKKK